MDINWMISYVNKSYPSCMLFKFFKGKLFEKLNANQYAKSDNTIQKGLKERIPNDILHVNFKRKISVSQSNWLYPKYGVCNTNTIQYKYFISKNRGPFEHTQINIHI